MKQGSRLLDLVVGLIAALALLPLMLALALAIRLQGPGTVIFRQRRLGRDGQVFTIHKFRTLRAGETTPAVIRADDSRITPIGRWLRRSKLDELPQLFDVLRGKMSLVGPRPEIAENLAALDAGLRRKLLSVRPGLTGPAALRFMAENQALQACADPVDAYRKILMPAKARQDIDYLEQRSLWSDLKLIIGTPPQLLSARARHASHHHVRSLLTPGLSELPD